MASDQEAIDAKPIRTLAPLFPAPLNFHTVTQSTNAPLIRVTPFTPFQTGPNSSTTNNPNFPFVPPNFAPFATTEASPISRSNGPHRPINATPISSFKTPVSLDEEYEDEEDEPYFVNSTSASGRKIKRPAHLSGYSTSRSDKSGTAQTGSSNGTKIKKPKPYKKFSAQDLDLLPPSSSDPRESVEAVLMTFDALRRRLLQLGEVQDTSKRADLQAGAIMMGSNLRANMGKRVGAVPGVQTGDIFYFRMELCVIGLHAPSMGGIDYMTKYGDEEEPVAICIVSAGGYENEESDPNVLIYSGQGNSDQKLERGNLALERSLHRKNEIRVVRGTKDPNLQTGKIYIYDGLYKIQNSWKERTKSGFNVFKYKLTREPGQPDGISVWHMTQKWIENPNSRDRVILPDLSSGAENLPVCLVNEIDAVKGPSHFTYVTQVKHLKKPLDSTRPLPGCKCLSVCLPGDPNCNCIQQNGGDLPYSSLGLLVSRKSVIYECGSSCLCTPNCRNRVSQKGTKLHFEVFKTESRGWGLRSWDPIRSGTFICEYTGEVIDGVKVDLDDEQDDYIFQTARPGEKTLKWNVGTELLGADGNAPSESFRALPITISAKNTGNVSRFMNHSCSPNVFWQPVLFDHGDENHPHIMFFAMKHIPPLTELTFDYGNSDDLGGREGGVGVRKAKRCLCGSANCRGYFG